MEKEKDNMTIRLLAKNLGHDLINIIHESPLEEPWVSCVICNKWWRIVYFVTNKPLCKKF